MTSATALEPQARGLCVDGRRHWSCSTAWFRGCCSIDPCDIGFCPDGLRLERASITSSHSTTDTAEPTEITLFPIFSDSDPLPDMSTSESPMLDSTSKRARETAPPLPAPSSTDAMTTMTDSGITHTIPNNSVVTVIMHTTITTRRPPSTASASDSELATNGSTGSTSIMSAGSPADSTSKPGVTAHSWPMPITEGQGLSTAAIAGLAVGGAVLVVILGLIAVVVRRRRGQRRDDASEVFSAGFNEGHGESGREEMPEEKHYPPPVSTHTTGTQGSSDPFAPFGGRADDPYRPHSGAFEMDGTSVAPIELPVNDHGRGSGQGAAATGRLTPVPRLDPVQESSDVPASPAANLDSIKTEGGRPAYINHWNQYKNLGQAEHS